MVGAVARGMLAAVAAVGLSSAVNVRGLRRAAATLKRLRTFEYRLEKRRAASKSRESNMLRGGESTCRHCHVAFRSHTEQPVMCQHA